MATHRFTPISRSKVGASGAWGLLFLLELVLLLVWPVPAEAIPTFARKYKTSCQTCHTVFPRLTPIGEAFRLNGYRFPECDGQQVKEEPVSLGAEAYKDVFPSDSVWPSDLPSTVPFSIVPKMRATLWDRDTKETVHFAGLNPTFDVYAAATLGDNISVFGKFQVNGPACQNCHTSLAVAFQLVPHTTFKIGRLQPEYFNFHQSPFHEMHDVLGPLRRVGANTWNYGKDVGVEVASIWLGRLRTVTGLMEGQDDFGTPFRSKNGYFRVAYKLGGMRLDGESEAGYTAPAKNWRERSIQFGVLGLLGSNRTQTNDAYGEPLTRDDRFWVVGGDANALWDDFNVFAGFLAEQHGQPTGTDKNIWVERYFGGIRYVPMPWLVPGVLFDYFNSELPGDLTYQVRPRIEILVRANVKARLDVLLARPVGDAFRFRTVTAGLDVGF